MSLTSEQEDLTLRSRASHWTQQMTASSGLIFLVLEGDWKETGALGLVGQSFFVTLRRDRLCFR